MPTREWFCQVCGNMNGHGKTAIPSSCMRCGLSHTARAYPAYDPRTGKVVDAPSFAAPIASTNYADFLRECAREYEDSAYACDTPLLRGFHASRLQKAKRLRELAARSPAPSDEPQYGPLVDEPYSEADTITWLRRHAATLGRNRSSATLLALADRLAAPIDERDGLAVLKVQTPTTGLNAVFGKMPALPFPEDPAEFVDELLIADRLRAAPILEEREATPTMLRPENDDARMLQEIANAVAAFQNYPLVERGYEAFLRDLAERLTARSSPPDQHPEVDALIRNLARSGRRAWDEGRYVDYQHFTHAIKALRSPAAIQEKTDAK